MSDQALTIYEGVKNNLVPFLQDMEQSFAALTQCPVQYAKAAMLTCVCEGITPLEFSRTYHIIKGKITLQSSAALARFRSQFGGDYTILERSPKRAAIEFERGGKKFVNEFTWEDAENSRWPWKDASDHSKGIKDNWSTPTDKKSMLWARCVSDGLTAFCPEVNHGIYTPEEMGDVYEAAVASTPTSVKSAAEVVQEAAGYQGQATVVTAQVVAPSPGSVAPVVSVASAAPASDPLPDSCEVTIDDAEIVEEGDTSFEPTQLEAAQREPCTQRQVANLATVMGNLGVSQEQKEKMLAKRGAQTLAQLTRGQANELITKLNEQARLAGVKQVFDEDDPESPFNSGQGA